MYICIVYALFNTIGCVYMYINSTLDNIVKLQCVQSDETIEHYFF